VPAKFGCMESGHSEARYHCGSFSKSTTVAPKLRKTARVSGCVRFTPKRWRPCPDGARNLCPHCAHQSVEVGGSRRRRSFVPASTITTEVAAGRFGTSLTVICAAVAPPITKSVTVFRPRAYRRRRQSRSPHPGGTEPISPRCPSHLIGVVCHASRSGHLCVYAHNDAAFSRHSLMGCDTRNHFSKPFQGGSSI